MPDIDAPAEVVAYLKTLQVDPSTLQQDPRHTIEPGQHTPDTNDRRAVAVLARLEDVRRSAGSHGLVVESTLGEGGHGVVRLATQSAVGRQVAVKTLREGVRSEQAVLRLLHEAWITGALEHPNVVPVYDLALDAKGAPLVVLKRIKGTSWEELFRDADTVRERFGARDLLEWNLGVLMQVASAVRFAHTRGILHRDIKPENVLLGEFGEVYLADWGIAVSLHDDGSGRLPLASDATELAGTLGYMAPEMLGTTPPSLSERTDVYLLGAVLFELLTGAPPHAAATPMAMVASILRSPPALPVDAPEELAAVCTRAMAREPEKRFASAKAFRAALEDFLRHRGSIALAAQAEARLAELRAVVAEAPGADPAEREQRVYNLFGECRFGFQQALRDWSENARARAGLAGAVTTMVDFELGQHDARAAAVLLAELDPRPEELAARVDAALRAREADQARAREAQRIALQHDTSVGQRTRWFLGSLLGVCWTALPAVLAHTGVMRTYRGLLLTPAANLALMFALFLWARETLTKTAVNRAISAVVALTFVFQLLLTLGGLLLGLTPAVTMVMYFVVWGAAAATLAATIDRRLWPTAAAFIAAFLAAAARPDARIWAMSAADLVLTVNVVTCWRVRSEASTEPGVETA